MAGRGSEVRRGEGLTEQGGGREGGLPAGLHTCEPPAASQSLQAPTPPPPTPHAAAGSAGPGEPPTAGDTHAPQAAAFL